jgi:ketosteroid isomerase-like protein
MTPQDAFSLYEQRINLHRFDELTDFISPDAVFWFSDGSHHGVEAIRQAFEKTWSKIQDEHYWLEDIAWIAQSDLAATCIYTFRWTGLWDGKPAKGQGRGTTTLGKQDGSWRIVHEHLSHFPK